MGEDEGIIWLSWWWRSTNSGWWIDSLSSLLGLAGTDVESGHGHICSSWKNGGGGITMFCWWRKELIEGGMGNEGSEWRVTQLSLPYLAMTLLHFIYIYIVHSPPPKSLEEENVGLWVIARNFPVSHICLYLKKLYFHRQYFPIVRWDYREIVKRCSNIARKKCISG